MIRHIVRLSTVSAVLTVAVLTGFPGLGHGQTLTIQSGSPTGSWYPAGVAITKAMQEANSNLKVTVSPGGALENTRAASTGADTDMAVTYASSWHGGLRGSYPYKQKWPDSRFVMVWFQVVYHGAVAIDSGINSYADLKDKRIMPGLKPWATNTMTTEILAGYGVTYDSIRKNGGKVEHVGYDDMVRGMADRQVDFIAAFQGYPTALWINANNSRPMKFLSVPKTVVDQMMVKIPGLSHAVLPKGTYEMNKDQDIATVGDVTIVIAHKDYNPDVVYQMVKTTMEKKQDLMKASKGLSFVTKETVLTGLVDGQIHPGAKRYFDEIGVKYKK